MEGTLKPQALNTLQTLRARSRSLYSKCRHHVRSRSRHAEGHTIEFWNSGFSGLRSCGQAARSIQDSRVTAVVVFFFFLGGGCLLCCIPGSKSTGCQKVFGAKSPDHKASLHVHTQSNILPADFCDFYSRRSQCQEVTAWQRGPKICRSPQ